MSSISGCCRNCCPGAFFYVWAVWLSGMMVFYFNSLMFVVLCTQILPVSSQLPPGQVPQTIRVYLLVCCVSPVPRTKGARWIQWQTGPRAWSGYVCAGGQIRACLSFSKERIHFNVTLGNAHYRNEIKYNIGSAKRVPRKWETIWFLWSPNRAACAVSESMYFVWTPVTPPCGA